jgi:hypothetical protein
MKTRRRMKMFEKFLSADAEAFRQRYEGTYGFYRDEKHKRLLVKLNYIRDNVCSFVDAQEIEYKLYPDSKDDIGFEFIPPESVYYNTTKGAMLVNRLAARQFSRGVNGKNIEIYGFDGNIQFGYKVNFENLKLVYESNVTPAEALLAERGSLALSRQFALSRDCVFLFKEQIGKYTRDGVNFRFKLNEPDLWRTEITDAINLLGCTAEISKNDD